ncbi:unnamed protein product [Cyclocybe aegerita]|uniref:Uncharacterized protein n=1 Tax=Cyclocybe aegerita TaxID=1973307 RepID=A0A8S0W041_CYCAE|nr:unnamed protein product [Cyclocybe aegerita]
MGKVKWSSAERNVLKDHVETFRGANSTDRRNLLITTMLPAIKELNKDLMVDQWKLHKAVRNEPNYFVSQSYLFTASEALVNNAKGLRARFSLSHSIPLKRVIAHLYPTELGAILHRRSNRATSGTPAYLQHYQASLKELKNLLTAQQLRDAEEEQDRWMEESYPPEVQMRTVATHGKKILRAMAEQLHKEMGMKVIMLEVHPAAGGDWWYLTHDFTGEFGQHDVQSFSERYPKEFADIDKYLNRYLQYQDGELNGENPEPVRVRLRKHILELARDRKGYPLLPSQSREDSLPYDKHIIWSFMTLHYCFATGRKKTKVPWACINDQQRDFIQPKYLPKGFDLVEPSDMKQEDVNTLLEFWRDRQSKCSPGEIFRFHQVTTSTCDLTMIPIRYSAPPRKKKEKPPTEDQPGEEEDFNSDSGSECRRSDSELETPECDEREVKPAEAGQADTAGDPSPARGRQADIAGDPTKARQTNAADDPSLAGGSHCGLQLPTDGEEPDSVPNEHEWMHRRSPVSLDPGLTVPSMLNFCRPVLPGPNPLIQSQIVNTQDVGMHHPQHDDHREGSKRRREEDLLEPEDENMGHGKCAHKPKEVDRYIHLSELALEKPASSKKHRGHA